MIFRLFTLLGVFLSIQGFVVAEDHPPHSDKTEHEQIQNEQDEHEHDHKGEEKEHEHSDHEDEESGEKEHGHEDEEESTGGVGPDNAVTAADEHEGIQLSPKAIELIGLKTRAYDGQVIPPSALVFYQDKIGVYRLRDGWFKLVPVNDLRDDDQIVIQGTGLLRVAELDAFSGEVGHSH